MRKIFASCLILAVLLALSMSVPAFAYVGEEEINYVENVNRRIDNLVEKAIEKAEVALANGDTNSVEEIREELSFETSNIVIKAMEWAERKGFTLVHEWITVIVGGEPTLIDPIHVLW